MSNLLSMATHAPGRSDSDQVTLLVFKDNLASRAFKIPLDWISRLGILLGTVALVALILGFLTVKYYRIARRTNPIRVQALEQELQDLRTKLAAAGTSSAANSPLIAAAPSLSPPTAAPEMSPTTNPQSVNPVTSTPQSNSSSISDMGNLLLGLIPPPSSGETNHLPDRASLPFTLDQARATWKGSTLNVHFNIQYTKGDGGNQQGRIVILTRGPDRILAYPSGVLRSVESTYLIQPDKGEFFSVSRFRETNAQFTGIPTRDTVQTVEAYILSMEGRLLALERITPDKTPAKVVKPAAPSAVAPAPTAAAPAPAAPAANPTGTGP